MRTDRTDPLPRVWKLGEQTKPVGGENPVSARASGVKKAAKSVAEGVEGVAQKATGVSFSASLRCPLIFSTRAARY